MCLFDFIFLCDNFVLWSDLNRGQRKVMNSTDNLSLKACEHTYYINLLSCENLTLRSFKITEILLNKTTDREALSPLHTSSINV